MMTSGAGRLLVSVHEILEPKMAYSRPRVEEVGHTMLETCQLVTSWARECQRCLAGGL